VERTKKKIFILLGDALGRYTLIKKKEKAQGDIIDQAKSSGMRSGSAYWVV